MQVAANVEARHQAKLHSQQELQRLSHLQVTLP